MKKISQLISSRVISLFESDEVGIVYNLIFDYKTKKCKYVCVLNEENNIMYSLKYQDVINFGKDCVYIKNTSTTEPVDNLAPKLNPLATPLNKKVFTIEGEYLGDCRDIEIDDNGNIINLVLENKKIEKSQIANIGSVIITSDKHIKMSKFKPETKIQSDENPKKVAILSSIVPAPTPTPSNKLITDSRFLMGRKILQDILAPNGEIIAKNGGTITKEILHKAGSYGKLLEVARFSTNK